MLKTWFNKDEQANMLACSDTDINEMLETINSGVNRPILIREHEINRTGFFVRKVPIIYFRLYQVVEDTGVQEIALPIGNDNEDVAQLAREQVVSFLYGVMCGQAHIINELEDKTSG